MVNPAEFHGRLIPIHHWSSRMEPVKMNCIPLVELSSLRGPAFSRDTMLVLACGLNKAALKSMEKRQDGDLEKGTWDETMSELDREWIFEDTSGSLVGKVLAKRFGLRQGEKLRVIDDCSIAGLNFSVGLSEKFICTR